MTLPAGEIELAARAGQYFGVGDAVVSVERLPGAANRLWRVEVRAGRFVVKEFRYTTEDRRWLAALRTAARFEHEVFATGEIVMPEPLQTADGQTIVVMPGSRREIAAVRMHRWIDGAAVPLPITASAAEAGGALLAKVQAIGRRFATADTGTLRWWRWQPAHILELLEEHALLDRDSAAECRTIISEAERLIDMGEALPGPWLFSHYDIKPQNAKVVRQVMALLDWDEAASCHPRLEAVEAALQWARVGEGRVEPELVAAFAEGFRAYGGELSGVTRADFAKWAASRAIWFEYLGRRALQEFDDDDEERATAALEALATLSGLGVGLAEVPDWINSF